MRAEVAEMGTAGGASDWGGVSSECVQAAPEDSVRRWRQQGEEKIGGEAAEMEETGEAGRAEEKARCETQMAACVRVPSPGVSSGDGGARVARTARLDAKRSRNVVRAQYVSSNLQAYA